MSEKITLKIFLKTVILFPFFMIFVFSPLMISIVLTSFLPNGRHLATKLYEFFGWVGLKFVGVNLIVEGAEKINISKIFSHSDKINKLNEFQKILENFLTNYKFQKKMENIKNTI